jgi:hypothetical protein
VVTPDELTMQKYWPAYDAVTKLKHEAAVSEIKTSARNSVSEIVQSISDRLDKIERSAAASLTLPIPPPPPVAPPPARMGPAEDDGSLDRGDRHGDLSRP